MRRERLARCAGEREQERRSFAHTPARRQGLRFRESAAVQAQLAEAKALAASRRLRETPSFLLSLSGTPGQAFSPQSLDSASFTGPLDKLLAGR